MLLFILLVVFAQDSMGDELISARCQSKCLHDMEHRYQVSLQTNSEDIMAGDLDPSRLVL